MYTKSDSIIHLVIQRCNKVSQLFAKLSMNTMLNKKPEVNSKTKFQFAKVNVCSWDFLQD